MVFVKMDVAILVFQGVLENPNNLSHLISYLVDEWLMLTNTVLIYKAMMIQATYYEYDM